LLGAPTRFGAECRLLALWMCGGWICSSSSLASGDESGSRAKEAWGVVPADVAPWCFSSHLAGWDFFTACFKACVRWCLSRLQFHVVLLCSGVGFSDGGVERTVAISANMEDPKDLTVISSFIRVFYVKLVGHLSTLYLSRRCLSFSVYVVPVY